MNIVLETGSKAPIYKQLVEQFEEAIRSGNLQPGEQIPSMNDFAVQLGISKETVKAALTQRFATTLPAGIWARCRPLKST